MATFISTTLYDRTRVAVPFIERLRQPELLRTAFIYLVAAVTVRAVTFGNPALHIDEQFYLLVGDRMLHGALPYVDIWDRKPIGLFALYAAMRALGGDGVLQYQLVALGFVIATALTINRLARIITSNTSAWWAGLIYIPYLSTFGCFGGQSPVFFNLFVALAALVVSHCFIAQSGQHLLRRGLLAMALIGAAIQIKYTVVFEGFAFGLALIVRARMVGWSARKTILCATLWCACALLPTLTALSFYQLIGQGHAFIEANFISIFLRQQPFLPSVIRLVKEVVLLAPLWLALIWAARQSSASFRHGTAVVQFLTAWAIAAVAGFLLFGTWLDHYVPPLLAPLLVLAAPAFGWSLTRKIYTALAMLVSTVGAIANTADQLSLSGNRAEVEQVSSIIRQHLDGGCFYMFQGDHPILYEFTNACTVTRFVFPQHLTSTIETSALGTDQLSQIRFAFEKRPTVVMTHGPCAPCLENPAALALASEYIRRDYRLITPVEIGRRTYSLYQRR